MKEDRRKRLRDVVDAENSVGVRRVDLIRYRAALDGAPHNAIQIRSGHKQPTVEVPMVQVSQEEADDIRAVCNVFDTRANAGQLQRLHQDGLTREIMIDLLASSWLKALFREYIVNSPDNDKELIPPLQETKCEYERMCNIVESFFTQPDLFTKLEKSKKIRPSTNQFSKSDLTIYSSIVKAIINIVKHQDQKFKEVGKILILWKRDLLRIGQLLENRKIVDAISNLIGRTTEQIREVTDRIEAAELLHIDDIALFRFEQAVVESKTPIQEIPDADTQELVLPPVFMETKLLEILKSSYLIVANTEIFYDIASEGLFTNKNNIRSAVKPIHQGSKKWKSQEIGTSAPLDTWGAIAIAKTAGDSPINILNSREALAVIIARTLDINSKAIQLSILIEHLLDPKTNPGRKDISQLIDEIETVLKDIQIQFEDTQQLLNDFKPSSSKYAQAIVRFKNLVENPLFEVHDPIPSIFAEMPERAKHLFIRRHHLTTSVLTLQIEGRYKPVQLISDPQKPDSLEEIKADLIEHLKDTTNIEIDDLSFTLRRTYGVGSDGTGINIIPPKIIDHDNFTTTAQGIIANFEAGKISLDQIDLTEDFTRLTTTIPQTEPPTSEPISVTS